MNRILILANRKYKHSYNLKIKSNDKYIYLIKIIVKHFYIIHFY